MKRKSDHAAFYIIWRRAELWLSLLIRVIIGILLHHHQLIIRQNWLPIIFRAGGLISMVAVEIQLVDAISI